ncbi:MAG: AAA family ATPase, partial [Acidimicrobiales bacterium]
MPRARLLEIHARDLGVIDEATLELAPGFTVVTGETGAGKTLLVGALALSLGLETEGARYALGPATRAVALFAAGGREIALAREVSGSGRLRATIDGAPASAEALRTHATGLVEIHGQHDSLRLRSSEAVLELVDRAGAVDASALVAAREELTRLRRERDAL